MRKSVVNACMYDAMRLTCVVDERINVAVARLDGLKRLLDGLVARDVDLDRLDAARGLGHLRLELFDCGFGLFQGAAAHQHEIRLA